MKDKEGTIQGESTKGRDAARIAEAAGTGGLIGAAADGGKGAAVGGAGGGLIGLAAVLFSRGPDLRLEAGSTMETVLRASDHRRYGASKAEAVSASWVRRLLAV